MITLDVVFMKLLLSGQIKIDHNKWLIILRVITVSGLQSTSRSKIDLQNDLPRLKLMSRPLKAIFDSHKE